MEENKTNTMNSRKERNIQKHDFNKIYRSNSQFFYKSKSNYDYKNRISLNPCGEYGNHYIRYNIPSNHINNYFEKCEINNNIYNSTKRANNESTIEKHLKTQKYQTLLKNDKEIKNFCKEKNKEIKGELNKKKQNLKQILTRIINDAILFSKKNNPVKSMLPENINEIVDKAKKETQDMSISLNISNLSKISSITGNTKKPKKVEFLSLLGVDVENMKYNHIDINIDKAWHFINKIAKGRNVEDILRYKVVNCIMNISEKKASEKAKKIYEKLRIYKDYMNKKKEEERKRKGKEEEKYHKELLKNNPKELIRQKMAKSLSQPKLFDKMKNNNKTFGKNKKLRKSKSAFFIQGEKKVARLNSYRDVDKIINFIDSSHKNSQSKLCKEHFLNIQMTKNMNINKKNLMRKNEIYLK